MPNSGISYGPLPRRLIIPKNIATMKKLKTIQINSMQITVLMYAQIIWVEVSMGKLRHKERLITSIHLPIKLLQLQLGGVQVCYQLQEAVNLPKVVS